MPAQMADVFSSWQVAEQPSPLVVLPSSHSSVPSTTPLPQVWAPATEWSIGSAALASVTARASSEPRRCIGPPVERGDRTLLPSSALDANARSCAPPVERRSGGVYRGRMASAGDSFHTRSVLEVGGTKFLIHRFDALGARAARLPFSLKILLENLLRGEDGRRVTREHVEALLAWEPTRPSEREIPFMPARVLPQDFTGRPAVL